MGVSVSGICKQINTVVIPVGAVEELTVQYNAAVYTPKFEKEVNKLIKGDDGSTALAQMLSKLVTKWDLVDDTPVPGPVAVNDGAEPRMYPLTVDALSELPTQFLATVVKSISEDMAPKPTKPSSYSSF